MGFRHWSIASVMAAMVAAVPAANAREVTIRVDAKSVPWRTGLNRKMPFGIGDGEAPTVLWGDRFPAGSKIQVTSKGQTTTIPGSPPFGPGGIPSWTNDRGLALFPSHYIDTSTRPAHLNELVGCFIDGDGVCIGKPFVIGEAAAVTIPQGTAGLSMGLNDDKFSDNEGAFTVTVVIPEPTVTVEGGR